MNNDINITIKNEAALAEADYVIDEAFLPFRPVLLGKTLHSILSGNLDFDGVELGIMRNWIGTPNSGEYRAIRKAFEDYGCEWIDDELIKFTSASGIPVVITIIPKNAKFFTNLDTLIYGYSTAHKNKNGHDIMIVEGFFMTPNPQRAYLEMIGLETDGVKTGSTLVQMSLKRKEEIGRIPRLAA